MRSQATAVAHPNIALIKYWGKSDTEHNLPAVGSISITLDTLATTTRVLLDDSLEEDRVVLNGRQISGAPQDRIRKCLRMFREIRPEMPHASVESSNSFPTAAGLASSASGFAALVVAVNHALGSGLDRHRLARLARRCSGSAARSLFGGYVELGFEPGRRETYTRQLLPPDEWPLRVVIAITDTGEKEVGSSAGMVRTATTSPYYDSWVEASEADLAAARSAIASRDFERLAEVSEHSCLKMHAVMLASRPGLLYWSGATLDCLHRIRALRRAGLPVFFTADAGPQVKAICTPEAAPRVVEDLSAVPGVESILSTGLGDGAHPVEE